ncbi:molybdopterin-dependent oxidoreductase [Inquilinus limosus]|uniref:molybdopterin-dependent oxidoreductase n=1 Tax=Inquilinus limosus TaxID=171674 RepID=UPI0004032360|nr:molybdopterin-dependent oxidoreductase [Inquilinus limosus]
MPLNRDHTPSSHVAAPARPPMEPAEGVRRIKLRPHEMTAPVTATADLAVIAHLGIPRIEPESWSLRIDGLVGRSLTLGLDDLKARPKTVVEAVHQCCGSPFEPRVPTRRVANVRWGGVYLAALLDEIGIDRRARFLWSCGLDGGDFAGAACDWYLKDLPLERLWAGGVLIAYELNDAPLPAEHGFPARLVVPGYYGTNSVKWLWRLHLAEHRADGLFTTTLYSDASDTAEIAAGMPAQRPVWAIAPEAVIVAPAPDAVIAAGESTEIWGWSWSFRGIERVEVSVDGGASYRRAILEPRHGWAWQRFSLPWRPADRGAIQLCARAFDVDGTTQPQEGARNAIHTVNVAVP